MKTTLVVILSQEVVTAFRVAVDDKARTPQVTVEVQYQQLVTLDQDAVKEVVPHTDRIMFGEAGSQSLDLGSVEGQVRVALLRSDGSVSTSILLKPAQSIEYHVTAADVASLVAGEPEAVAPAVVVVGRRAQLVSIGGVQPDFGKSQIAVHVVDSTVGFAAGGPLSALGFNRDRSSSIELSADQSGHLRPLSWESTHVGVDGRFTAEFERPIVDGVVPAVVGWLWWLSGARSLAGFVKDDLARRQREVAIPLPALQPLPGGPGGETPCDCEPPRRAVPAIATEAEVADNPGVYAEDPGAFCKPFTNPERVLNEKAFAVIARVQQPDIGPMGSVRVHTQHLLDLDLPVSMTLAADATRRNTVIAQPLSHDALAAALLGAGRPTRVKTPPSEVLVQERLPSGRVLMDSKHPAQWEADIAQYQSASVALGHILEFRVRTRSNGYSLGNVASTLTLAPRQTKRIQKIEFERIERARREESTQLVDSVNDELTRERDYSDTVSAYLSEWATGSSSSGSAAASGGIGFAIPPIVGGVGGGTSKAWSESSQEGARHTGASEQQRLRDAIRRHGDSLRRMQATVVTEVAQQETVTGTTEVLRNPNYGHSLTVIYYQILRHLKVTTEFAGVRECLFVPFAIKPFTLQRVYRWREAIEKYLRSRRYLSSFKYLRDVATNFLYSGLEPGTRAQQKLSYMRGSIHLTLAVERPHDAADGKFSVMQWQPFSPFLGIPAQSIWARLAERALAERDHVFQREYAPGIAAKWVNKLRIEVGGTDLKADCTLATRYGFNGTVRVDFVVPAQLANLYSRAQLHEIKVVAASDLPPGSVATVTEMSIRYGTVNFQRTIRGLPGADDLVTPGTGALDAGATLTFPLDAWDNVDERLQMKQSVSELIEHLNEHVEYYHKAIWWSMDRDRLFMLLDGFYAPGTDKVSIASVVDREPVAIIGNSLVYRVGAGCFLGLGRITSPSQLYEAYAGREPAQDPLLLSLPTDGLYAQTIMDDCLALEEHQGSVDWVLDDPDPDLGAIDASLLTSRRADATSALTPTPMPGTIINLQNAPDAPAPAGLQGALGAVTSPDAFRDMAGLAGTQANAAAALQSAAALATNFGNQAAALKLADIASKAKATEDVNKNLAAVKKAKDQDLISDTDASGHTNKILSQVHSADSEASFGEEAGLKAAVQEGRGVKTARSTDQGVRVVEISPSVFAADGGTASTPEVIDYGEISGPVDDDGNPIDGDDAVSDVVYGGYDLAQGDSDQARRWGGAVRNAPDDLGNSPPQGARYVRELQADLRTIGIMAVSETGTFDAVTKWAVREFQIYAGMDNIAQLNAAALGATPPARYRDRLDQVANPDVFTGNVTGVVDDETRLLLALWLSYSFRIPVVIEAWNLLGGVPAGAAPVAGNLWAHNALANPAPRMFVTDLTQYYEPRVIEREVLGTYAGGANGGPNATPPGHTQSEALPLPLVGADLGALTPAQLSTFKVLRAVSEVECYGFLDGVNCWDDQTVSLPLHHGTLSTPGDRGEAPAYLHFFAATDPAGYATAFGRFGLGAANDVLGPGSRRHVAMATLDGVAGPELVDTRAEFNYLKNWHWFYRWVMAGRSVPAHQRAVYAFAARRLRLMLETEWTAALHFDDGSGQRAALLGDVFTSERAVALLFRWHVNMPGHVVSAGHVGQPIRNALQNARTASPGLFAGANIHAWTAVDEAALVAGILLSRDNTPGAPERSTMNPVAQWPDWGPGNNPRGYTLDGVAAGRLSTVRGSMLVDTP